MQQAGKGEETRALSAREAPNPKLEAPKKFQAPSFKRGAACELLFGYWCLRFAWDLGFGIWDFRRS
jgi:hypothetical protein